MKWILYTGLLPGDLRLPQAFSRNLLPATIDQYWGQRIRNHLVNVNFSKIIAFKGTITKFF
jgi:hypothetical protein